MSKAFYNSGDIGMKTEFFSDRCMMGYKVLNVVNAHVVCVLPIFHIPLLSYQIIV